MDWYKQAAELGLPFPVKTMDLIQNADKNTDGEDNHGTEKGMEIILECLNGAVFSGELLPDMPVEDLAVSPGVAFFCGVPVSKKTPIFVNIEKYASPVEVHPLTGLDC